jgi:hypothetical protein
LERFEDLKRNRKPKPFNQNFEFGNFPKPAPPPSAQQSFSFNSFNPPPVAAPPKPIQVPPPQPLKANPQNDLIDLFDAPAPSV